MCAPVPEDPQDAEVASQYKSDINKFNKKAKLWAEMYAMNQEANKLKELMDMGFSEKDSRDALNKADFDVEKAINILLSS
jgi:ubiquitin-conjugating enzyme (huntingtin interacting protein 2)